MSLKMKLRAKIPIPVLLVFRLYLSFVNQVEVNDRYSTTTEQGLQLNYSQYHSFSYAEINRLDSDMRFKNDVFTPSLHLSELTFIISSSTFQERGEDFGRLCSVNAAFVAEEGQEEMRSVFAVGCDCPKVSGQGTASSLMDDLKRMNRVHAVVNYVTFQARTVILGSYYIKLQLQAEERGVVSIKGVSANRFLAMKEDGRLLALNQIFLAVCTSKLENWHEKHFWKSDDKIKK
ncbi:fibroblast growth factor 2 [Limosa lapponica baueri]|uniref:Fibroblast growth factor 2 n=1 Tax=Limosa lapponica baueri TaxID=1758121 RepID=A0A2I0TZR9_LIMLA|nr:fibroblast growth factor 2 [Limosa lapponica baueri]